MDHNVCFAKKKKAKTTTRTNREASGTAMDDKLVAKFLQQLSLCWGQVPLTPLISLSLIRLYFTCLRLKSSLSIYVDYLQLYFIHFFFFPSIIRIGTCLEIISNFADDKFWATCFATTLSVFIGLFRFINYRTSIQSSKIDVCITSNCAFDISLIHKGYSIYNII